MWSKFFSMLPQGTLNSFEQLPGLEPYMYRRKVGKGIPLLLPIGLLRDKSLLQSKTSEYQLIPMWHWSDKTTEVPVGTTVLHDNIFLNCMPILWIVTPQSLHYRNSWQMWARSPSAKKGSMKYVTSVRHHLRMKASTIFLAGPATQKNLTRLTS